MQQILNTKEKLLVNEFYEFQKLAWTNICEDKIEID